MPLLWSPHAIADRDAIFDHIAADKPAAAIASDTASAQRIERLVQFPRSERAGRVTGTCELVIPRTPFIAIHRLTPTGITILRIRHAARQWPPTPSSSGT